MTQMSNFIKKKFVESQYAVKFLYDDVDVHIQMAHKDVNLNTNNCLQ